MGTIWKKLLSLVRSVLAIILGYTAVFLVNILKNWILLASFPVSAVEGGIPLTTAARLVDLVMLFLAGMAGGFVVVLASHVKPFLHALMFGIIAFIFDLYVVWILFTEQPTWYTLGILITVPIQVWIGAKLGQSVRARMGK